MGDFDTARQLYLNARSLYLQGSEEEQEELKYDYGWISNNLAFVLSWSYKTLQTAISTAEAAVEYWRFVGNNMGLGAGSLVLGIADYRDDRTEEALEAFQQALDIFEPLKYSARDRLSEIYAWRGALYHHMQTKEYSEKAESDLKKSLEFGSKNFRAMALNRLGRVYMFQEKWDLAEKMIRESFKLAKQLPDYVYWLASIARLTTIAAAKKDFHRLGELEQMLEEYRRETHDIIPDNNSFGVAYLGFAKLVLVQNDPSKIDTAVDHLKEGIRIIIESGQFVPRDILKRLEDFEKYHFDGIKPEIIHRIGQKLQEHFSEKEIKNSAYSIITPKMYRWATWKKEKKNDE